MSERMKELSILKKKARELSFAGVPTKRGGVNGLKDVRVVRVADVDDLLSEALDMAEGELTRNYQLGLAAGLREASALLRKKAGNLFVGGNDERAKWVRDVAYEVEARAEQEQPEREPEQECGCPAEGHYSHCVHEHDG